jgi:hypothetical protein
MGRVILKAKAWWSKPGAGIGGDSHAVDGQSPALPLFLRAHARMLWGPMTKKEQSERKGRRNFDTAVLDNTMDMTATEKTGPVSRRAVRATRWF